MAQVKSDYHTNDENEGQVSPLSLKNMDETLKKRPAKAFEEIKNVIHNQGRSKGKKSPEISSKSCEEPSGTQNPFQQREKQLSEDIGTQKSVKVSTVPSELNDDAIDMLNFFDFDRECCRKPYKSERQIWSEMNVFDEEMLNKIIENCSMGNGDSSDDDDGHFDLDKSDSGNILDIYNSKLFPPIFSDCDSSGSDDIILPCVQLENFEFF